MSSRSIARNDPCPCGSGKRYKQCCGAGAAATASRAPSALGATADFGAAQALHRAGRIDDAERIYLALIDAEPRNAQVLHYLGVCSYQRGDLETAERRIRSALALNDAEPMASNNLGLVHQAQRRHDNALACFDRALALAPEDAVAYNNRGLVLQALRRPADAVRDFRRAVAMHPAFPEALYNLAKELFDQKLGADALVSCDAALALSPRLPAAHGLRGSILRLLHRNAEALASWDRALALDPGFVEVYINRAGALHDFKRDEDAATDLAHALRLQPDAPYARGDLLHYRMCSCDWTDFDAECARIAAALDQDLRVASPFTLLALPFTAAQQQRCARNFAADKHPRAAMAPRPIASGENKKIRIGYFSADFRDHPTAHLIAGMIECHDRSAFEIVGFYAGPPVADEWHARFQASFDRFFDVRTLGDAAIAARMRELGIDIAVDLMGHTANARLGVFAHGAAPVQVEYLGYPGTTGAPYMDYLLADAVVIPADAQRFYDEKIVVLPNSYQANDGTKPIATGTPVRGAVGLPEEGFVFCCFNACFKFTPDLFDVWMRLLDRVPGSVLWLRESNAAATRNLLREAQARGIAPDRLVFARRWPLPEHLARHRCADLFLDAFNYNAHTTASDALWAGLPVLTRIGETFASRVAASLLEAAGLPELIARSTAEYEARALELASSPARLAALRRRLASGRADGPLFDTARFTRHVDDAYRTMLARQRAGLPPAAFAIAP